MPPRHVQLPDKLFFRIGEVADLVGVRPHVLRYWEEEFGVLRPMKTRGAHRQYRRRDVELALVIKRLLHEEGFTVAGARKRLREMGHLEARGGAARDARDGSSGRETGGREVGGRDLGGRDLGGRDPGREVGSREAGRDVGRSGAELELRAELLGIRAELAALAARIDAIASSTRPVSLPAADADAWDEIPVRAEKTRER